MKSNQDIINDILGSDNIVFLTGAGVSTLSGIPDYRSMSGLYHTNKKAEYLLSHSCFINEPTEFYEFVKLLYHLDAKPNIIHQSMAQLSLIKKVTIITQNIDDLHLHNKATNVILFHGSLYDLYCTKCHQKISVNDYLNSNRHDKDNGLIRPNVVLYEESLDENVINESIAAISKANMIIVVGTTLQVYPFASLVNYAKSDARIILINNEETAYNNYHDIVIGDAAIFFKELSEHI
ncbi:MAG: NAD-dependent protein deacylase [Bacilli bacterium]|jgi:NAD-dependent deacetylase|nr:NAD-dependent protein deacylase [Bacilli bacterium]